MPPVNDPNLRSGFTLGPWTVLPLESRLHDGEDSRRVQPKSMDVLLCLAEARGEVVERDELLRQVWGDRAVTDEPLTRCIGELRRALGDSSAERAYIETIPKRGYRLMKPAEPLAPPPPEPERADEPPASPVPVSRTRKVLVALGLLLLAVLLEVSIERSLEPGPSEEEPAPIAADIVERSIAVLPFTDMSATQDQEYMGDGVAEELLNLLARIRDLRVISRSSTFSLKGSQIDIREVARRFGVAYVLEGSVRTSGDRIRITAQLIDGLTDTHIWSEEYERELDDVFAIQDEIAAAVVGKLQITLLGEPPRSRPTDPRAYAVFLQARALHEQPVGDSMQRAVELYKAAVEIDPEYVPAWVWLAAAYDDTVASIGLPRDEVVRLAKKAIATALAIEPDDPLALGMDSLLTIAWDDDPERAAALIATSARTGPEQSFPAALVRERAIRYRPSRAGRAGHRVPVRTRPRWQYHANQSRRDLPQRRALR